jgi:hypothetical protein
MVWQGMLTLPLAFALQRALKYPLLSKENSLTPLLIQAASVQVLALPAVIIAYALIPAYVPAVFAAIVGGHFLPYIWIQRSAVYGILAVTASLGAYTLVLFMQADSFYYINFLIGAALVVAAFVVRAQVERESPHRPGAHGG